MLSNFRLQATRERSELLYDVREAIKNKLKRYGELDEKAVQAVTERYVFHLKEDVFVSRKDQLLQSYKTDVKRPYMIHASNFELKRNITELASMYSDRLRTDQMDIDNGQQFTYQMQTLFPIEFEKQVVLAQFEVEDSGKDPDR